jgi:hypothetical protein
LARRRTSRKKLGKPLLIRYAAIGLVTLVLLWLSVAVSVAGFLRDRRPDIALRLWPGDGFAQAIKSERMLQERIRAPRHDEELRLAREALAAEPTSARAARIIALLSPDAAASRRSFAYARKLSRRDLFINMWFIEEAVQRNDVAGALAQYDVTLRTSSQAPRLLFPILSSALAQRDLGLPIARLLADGGEWVPDFVDHVLAENARTGDLGRVVLYQPRILGRLAPAAQARLIAQLADARQFEAGSRIYRLASGRATMSAADRAPVAGGALPPYDWSVIDSGNFGASAGSGDGALQVYSEAGFRGTVARRLIRLAPGAYRLSAAGSVAEGGGAGQASWAVTCAESDSSPAATVAIAGPAAGRKSAAADFLLGPGCGWFWINLEVGSMSEDGRFEATLSGPVIAPLRG